MAIAAPSSRITLLAAAADVVAVVVFAALGRLSHGEADDLLGLVGTVAPFAVGSGGGAGPRPRCGTTRPRCGPVSSPSCAPRESACCCGRASPAGCRSSFAVVATLSLAVLLLGWRGLAALVSRTAHRTAR